MDFEVNQRNMEKAALCGEPSYVWRAGQERRLKMILEAAGDRISGNVLDNGCGVGMYSARIAKAGGRVFSLEYDLDRAIEAHHIHPSVMCAAGEYLPFVAQVFDMILSHEVLEHVWDDLLAVKEMVRVLRPGGRLILFVPNQGYPFETHGIYWRGRYRFGNIPLVNYLPRVWRNKLAPHVRVYRARELRKLFHELPVRIVKQKVIFGAYDNLIARRPVLGRVIRSVLQALENSALQILGLSHFWVVEKIE